MKNKKTMLLLIALVLLLSSFSFTNVKASDTEGYKVTLTETDGLNVDVSGIEASQVTLDQEYIKANVNEAYVNKGDTLTPKDVILAKNLFANRNALTSGTTINSLWFNTPEAFIVETDMVFPLYDIDESSNYYVAYVDTMHYDSNSNVEDVCFAYTNLNGEVITDAIYDNETGLVYLPKYYVEENKNGYGIENVQVELLQVVDTDTPKATIEAKVTSDVDEFKKLETEGLASVDLLNVKFGINLNIDDEAISNLTASYIKVKVNGFETDQWTYYSSSGILVLNAMPSTVRTLEIEISQENFDNNADRVTISGVSYTDTTTADMFGEWEVNQTPAVGSTFTIEGSTNIDVWYDAWNHDDPRGSYVPEMHVYGSGNTLNDTTLNKIFDEVLRGNGNLDLNNLTEDNTWLQYDVTMLQDTTVTASDGTQMVIPAGHWYLKCTHGARTFTTTHYIDPADPHRHDHTYELRGKVLQTADDYIIVGIVGSTSHSQSGAGIFKISVAGQTGGLEIKKTLGATEKNAKIDLSGAKFRLTSKTDPSLQYETNVSGSDGKCRVEGVKFGDYVLSEIQTPVSAFKMADRDITIDASNRVNPDGSVKTIEIENESKPMVIHIKKSTKLTEQEKTDATVAGAIFTVYTDAAATNPFIDKDGNVVTIGPTDANGEATSAQMRTGTYYLKETTFPTGIDKDKVIDEATGTTYATKIYVASGNPDGQTERPLKVDLNIDNEPKRNDIVIQKNIGETSNTSKVPLDGCEFTATLKSSIGTDQVFSRKCTAETTKDTGYCIIEDLPYGEYVVEETKVNPYTLKADKFTVFVSEDRKDKKVPYAPKDGVFETTILDQNPQTEWLDGEGHFVDIPKVMTIKIRKVDANRTDDDRVDFTQGDAQLEGAKYQIYEFNEETQKYDKEVYSITVDHRDEDGYWCAESGELLVGKYMVKEMIARSEDGHDYSYAKGYLVDPKEYEFEVIPEQQQERLSRHHSVSKEEVQRGFVYIWKEDEDRSNVDSENDSDKNPAAGAIMRLTLLSDTSIYYEVKLDEKGYGEFVETNDETHKSTAKHDSKKYYPYTIPFGKYKITETEEGTNTKRTNFYTQPENVDISKQDDYQYRIEMDVPVPVWLKIIKNDKANNSVVKIPNGTYKVWDVKGEKFLEFMVYPGNKVSEFNTTKDGYLILPEKIYPGEYIIYETNAPKGYYLDDEWRIPEEKADIGDATKGGKKIKIDKIATGLAEDAENPGQVQVGQYQYDANIYNTHLKANLLVEKKGKKLVNTTNGSATYKTTYDEEVKLTTVVPLYEEVGLEGVKFELKAKDDIYDVNGVKQASKNEVVSTFTTNEKGIGKSADVYPGEYILHEVSAPEGYVLADDKVVYLENENQYEKVKTATTTVIDKRQNLTIDLEKLFEDSKYVTGEEEKYAVFGVYVKENIKNYAGEETLFANDLVELIIVDKDNTTVTIDADLPEGKYYVKELYAAFPYSINAEEKTFELKYKGNEPNYKIPTKLTIKDDVESSTVLFVKIDQASDENLVMNGKTVQTSSNLDEKIDKTLDMFKEMSVDDLEAMADAISKFYEENDIKVVPQATYEIWLDEKGNKKLCERDANGKVTTAQFTTDGSGAFAIAGIPKGEYYLKEIVAPDGYELTEEPVKFIISDSDVGATLYQAIQETNVVPKLLHKKDVFTGDKVPNCLFEITDETGKVIVRSITDEFGDAYFPLSAFKDGEKYYFQEISVDNDVYYEAENVLYKLNTEKHEFTAKINPETKLWDAEPIEVVNNRPVKNFIFRKIDKDTGDVLKGCVFSIVLLDDEGNPYINDEGEMIYLVKDAVTGDNGECLIEDVPFGTYKVIEITPPEGYELPEEGEFENIFTIDYNSPDVVEFVLPNGDIPVVAISILGLVSIVGIAYVVVKKVKFSKEA